MRFIYVQFLFILFLAGCRWQKEIPQQNFDPTLKKTVTAKVIYIPFENKAGRVIDGVGDYFLVYENQEWFIKFSAGLVLRDDVAAMVDNKATFILTERSGLWDTDDPNVQSRVGPYVILHEIVKP